jgi:hypothetical protein
MILGPCRIFDRHRENDSGSLLNFDRHHENDSRAFLTPNIRRRPFWVTKKKAHPPFKATLPCISKSYAISWSILGGFAKLLPNFCQTRRQFAKLLPNFCQTWSVDLSVKGSDRVTK